MNDALLTAVLGYGPPILGLALLLGALGIPLPGTMLLLAAGAFVRQGIFGGALAVGLGLLGVVGGDWSGYALGYLAGPWLARRFGRGTTWQRAERTFRRWGGIAVFLTRFLVTPLGAPTNVIAGASHYPVWRFVVIDTAGELLWVLGYGGLGYLFANSWETLDALIGNLTGILLGLLGLGVATVLTYRFSRGRSRPEREQQASITS